MLLFLIHRLWKFMVYWGHFLPLFSISFLLYILPMSVHGCCSNHDSISSQILVLVQARDIQDCCAFKNYSFLNIQFHGLVTSFPCNLKIHSFLLSTCELASEDTVVHRFLWGYIFAPSTYDSTLFSLAPLFLQGVSCQYDGLYLFSLLAFKIFSLSLVFSVLTVISLSMLFDST